jgi:hypothetical protein
MVVQGDWFKVYIGWVSGFSAYVVISSQVIVSSYPDSASTNYWVVVVEAINHTAI